MVAVVGYVMRTFRPARDLYAIGSNPEAAVLAGVRVPRRVFSAFAISGALAGLGGALWLAEFATVASTAGTGYEFNVVAACRRGRCRNLRRQWHGPGRGVGCAALNTIDQALVAARVSSFWNQAVAGMLLAGGDRLRPLCVGCVPRESCEWKGHTMATPELTADCPSPWPNRGHCSRHCARRCAGRAGLVMLFFVSLVYGWSVSRYFFNMETFFFAGLNFGEIAIMALPMTLIIITGEIDLSVASMLGLSASTWATSSCTGGISGPPWESVCVVGILGGALNGVLVTRLGLPSIAVTIGTLTLYRGSR